jgi:hypothetical protein
LSRGMSMAGRAILVFEYARHSFVV